MDVEFEEIGTKDGVPAGFATIVYDIDEGDDK
jgi:hypothetical protein